jgi:hypothetical protein
MKIPNRFVSSGQIRGTKIGLMPENMPGQLEVGSFPKSTVVTLSQV